MGSETKQKNNCWTHESSHVYLMSVSVLSTMWCSSFLYSQWEARCSLMKMGKERGFCRSENRGGENGSIGAISKPFAITFCEASFSETMQ